MHYKVSVEHLTTLVSLLGNALCCLAQNGYLSKQLGLQSKAKIHPHLK